MTSSTILLGLNAQQLASLALIAAMLALFVWDRWRYDVVATMVLLAAVVIGLVPADKAFDGFSDPIIPIIASVMVVSRAISASGVLDHLLRRMLRRVSSASGQVGILTACVTFLSAFIKNIGTLGIFMPIAIQAARKSNRSSSIYLMPLAFGSLIGGTITLIGTSPNLLISSIRADQGKPGFGLFDFAWVGLPLSVLAIMFLAVGWRLLPKDRKGTRSPEEQFEIESYTIELAVPGGSPLIGKTVRDLEGFGDDEALVRSITRGRVQHAIPHRNWPIGEGDIVSIQADPATIKALTETGGLTLAAARELGKREERDDLDVVEAIVGPESILIGETPESMRLRQLYDVNLIAVSRAGANKHTRLMSHRFAVGDVVAIQGWEKLLPQALQDLGCLPLVDRGLGLGGLRRGLVPILVLAVAMIAIALKLVPVAIGFFAAAIVLILGQQISLRQAYAAIDGPILVLLGALLPLGAGLKAIGLTDIIGNAIAGIGASLPGWGAVAMMIAVAMAVTPFLNNAASALMLGPIAAVVAKTLGYDADPFLMAVALGCACDFLTPIGHQNNLLVMGPGGYKFTDYWRLGLPLSIMVLVIGTMLILMAWPLKL